MKTYGRKLIPITAIGILAAIGYVITNSRQAAAQGPPGGLAVNIANPLPLPVTGTATVSGTVDVSPLPLPVSGSVNIDAARQPFQIGLCTPGFPGGCPGSQPSSFTVPGNKRLVIEFYSGSCSTENLTDTIASVTLTTKAGGAVVQHEVVPQFAGNPFNFNIMKTVKAYDFGQVVQVYADPGSTVGTNAAGFPGASLGCLVGISGYLVSQ